MESGGHSTHSDREHAKDAGREARDVAAASSKPLRKSETMRAGGSGKGSGVTPGVAAAVKKNAIAASFARTGSTQSVPLESFSPANHVSSAPSAAETIRDKMVMIRSRGRKLVSGAVERVRDSSTAVTRVFRPGADAESVEWTHTGQMAGHGDGVWELSGSRWEGQQEALVASASADKTARIWSVEQSRELIACFGHKGSVNSARFHPQERLLCTASGDKSAIGTAQNRSAHARSQRHLLIGARLCDHAS